PAPPASVRFDVPLSAESDRSLSDTNGLMSLAVSPDGQKLAFVVLVRGTDRPILAVRAFDADDARQVPGTEDATFPFWSPESRFIGFFADGKLKTIDPNGGPVQVVC